MYFNLYLKTVLPFYLLYVIYSFVVFLTNIVKNLKFKQYLKNLKKIMNFDFRCFKLL